MNLSATSEEKDIIAKIAKRAINMMTKNKAHYDLLSMNMDLCATHLNGTSIDFKKLEGFDDFNFAHDIYGIVTNLNRETGELENCFLPRSANA